MLMGSSMVIHSVLAIAAMPLLGRLAKPPVDTASVSIELVDLTTVDPTDSGEANLVPSESANSDSPDAAATPLPSKIVGPIPSNEPAPNTPEPTVPTQSPISAQLPTPKTVSPSIAPPLVSAPETAPDSETNPDSTASPPTSPSSAPAPPLQPEASEFLTVPIDRPPPDVSETLPLPDDAVDPSSLAQVGVDETRTPVRLTASLETERIPAEQAEDTPDQLAAPMAGKTQQDVATLGDAACLNTVTPAVLQAIGTRVGVQVATDVAGQVVQTVLQTPSQNPDYDRLAECLVQHWGFNPAETQDQPVPSRALLVWVTIEPSNPAPSNQVPPE